jgi:hypothetical protein
VATTSGGSYADAAGCTAATTSTGLTCTASGLTNGTAYSFKVAAINAAGTGPYSSASAAVTPGVTYALGSIGPGGGTVFYVASSPFTSTGSACGTSCRYLEMAVKAWRSSSSEPAQVSCDTAVNLTIAGGSAIGTGAANTAAIDAGCGNGVGRWAASYSVSGFDDWILPSADELNAMCNYSRNPSAPAAPSVECTGSQDAGFAASSYGFGAQRYWSSTYGLSGWGSCRYFDDGHTAGCMLLHAYPGRPIRVF